MNTLQLHSLLPEYFAFHISPKTAEFHVTPQYRKLMDLRFEAESNAYRWKSSLITLQKNICLPVKDETELDRANCFECSLVLSEEGEIDVIRKTAWVFCSILLPVAYIAIEESHYSNSEVSKYTLPESICEQGCHRIQEIARWLTSEGYTLLLEAAHDPVEELSLEYSPEGGVTLFDCLFSEFADDTQYAFSYGLVEKCLAAACIPLDDCLMSGNTRKHSSCQK